MFKKGKYLTNTSEFLTEAGIRKSRYLMKGELVLTNSGTVGIPAILQINGCIHDGYLAFLNLEEWLSKDYLYFLFESYNKLFWELAPKGTQANLNTTILKNLIIPLPAPSEQKTIADILVSIDNKIDFEGDCLSALDQLFKTLLNNLMTGKIRVQNFEVPKA